MKKEYYSKTNEIYSDICKNPIFKASKLVDCGHWWGSDYKIIGNKYIVYGSICHEDRAFDGKVEKRKIQIYFRKCGTIHWLISGTELQSSDFRKETLIKLFKLIDTLYNEWCKNDKDRIKNNHRNEVLSDMKMESGRNHETIMVFDKFLDKAEKWQEQKETD